MTRGVVRGRLADPAMVRRAAVGVAIGLITLAVLATAYAWVFRTPDLPVRHTPKTTSFLTYTSWVVAAATALTLGALAVGWRFRHSPAARRYLRVAAPVLTGLAVTGLFGLYWHPVAALASSADYEQEALQSGHVDDAARLAWWSGCLAVLVASALMFSSARRKVLSAPTTSQKHRRLACPVVAAVIVVAGAATLTVISDDRSPFLGSVARDVHIPPLPDRPDAVAYRIAGGTTIPVAAGAGFVRQRQDPDTGVTVEGIDGASGDPLWWWSADDLLVFGAPSATGTGPDSVVYAQISASMARGRTLDGSLDDRHQFPYVGIDASTGEHLWTRYFGLTVPAGSRIRGHSTRVILLQQPIGASDPKHDSRWLGVSPRTGDVMWSRGFDLQCDGTAFLTDEAVVVDACTGTSKISGAYAAVLDPATGRVLRELGVDELGDPAAHSATMRDVRGTLALVYVARGASPTMSHYAAVDGRTGHVVQTFEPGELVSFIDDHSLRVARPTGDQQAHELLIFDLADRRFVPTGLVQHVSAAGPAEPPWQWVGLAESWVALSSSVPDPAAPDGPGRVTMHIVDHSGSLSTSDVLCPQHSALVSMATAAPGALIVACGEEIIGLN